MSKVDYCRFAREAYEACLERTYPGTRLQAAAVEEMKLAEYGDALPRAVCPGDHIVLISVDALTDDMPTTTIFALVDVAIVDDDTCALVSAWVEPDPNGPEGDPTFVMIAVVGDDGLHCEDFEADFVIVPEELIAEVIEGSADSESGGEPWCEPVDTSLIARMLVTTDQ